LQERLNFVLNFKKRASKVKPLDDNNNFIVRREIEKRNVLTSITIGSAFLLSTDLWPKGKDVHPKEIRCENLKELHIQVPSKDKIQDMRNCKDKLYEFFGLQAVESCLEKEERMKKNVYFILEVLLGGNLCCFSFQNGRYGSYLTHTTGYIFWDAPLKSFISKHAKSLKRIYIDSMGSSLQFNSWNFCNAKNSYAFPLLEEISLRLWNWNNVDRNLFDCGNYWISLLNEQTANTLCKLEWYSCESLSWNQMILPIIQENKKSLQEILVLGFGCPIEAAVTSDSKLYNSGFIIDCTQFSLLHRLTVIKLQMFRSVLTNLELLPSSIQEIEIHCVRIKSCDLAHLSNLPNLKRLTLFNLNIANTSWSYPNPCFATSSLKKEYGVPRAILKTLLGIRSLHLLHICGFIRTPSAVPECAFAHGISWKRKLSSSTIINGFSKKEIKDDDKELDIMLDILKPVAKDCDRSLLRITED